MDVDHLIDFIEKRMTMAPHIPAPDAAYSGRIWRVCDNQAAGTWFPLLAASFVLRK